MANGPQKLPSIIFLRAAPTMDAKDLREALNCSRSNLYLWRKNDGLPRPQRVGNDSLTDTADLAAFAARNGITIIYL